MQESSPTYLLYTYIEGHVLVKILKIKQIRKICWTVQYLCFPASSIKCFWHYIPWVWHRQCSWHWVGSPLALWTWLWRCLLSHHSWSLCRSAPALCYCLCEWSGKCIYHLHYNQTEKLFTITACLLCYESADEDFAVFTKWCDFFSRRENSKRTKMHHYKPRETVRSTYCLRCN